MGAIHGAQMRRWHGRAVVEETRARRASGFHWLALCRERLPDSSTAPLRLFKSSEARKK